MKSLVTISIILLHLFTTTIAGELLRLPLLIHHYFEHDENDEHESVIHFLKEHYVELHKVINQHHADDHKHLPFKTNYKAYLASSVLIVPRAFVSSDLIAFNTTSLVVSANELSVYSHFLADIWQPPKA